MGELTHLKPAPGVTDIPPRAAGGGQNKVAGFTEAGRGRLRLAVLGGIEMRWAHQLPGKPAEEHAPHGPFDQLSQWRHSDTKIRATSSWARGGYTGTY